MTEAASSILKSEDFGRTKNLRHVINRTAKLIVE